MTMELHGTTDELHSRPRGNMRTTGTCFIHFKGSSTKLLQIVTSLAGMAVISLLTLTLVSTDTGAVYTSPVANS